MNDDQRAAKESVPSPDVSGRHARPPQRDTWREQAANIWRQFQQWLATNTRLPSWVPAALRRPAMPYTVVLALQVLATFLTVVFSDTYHSFSFKGLLTLLVVVFAAIQFGAAPGLFATMLGTILLYFAVLEPRLTLTLDKGADVIGALLFLLVGISIMVMASRTVHAQLEAEAASDEMASFLGITGHELRNPLTGIKANVQLAERHARRAAQSAEDPEAALTQVMELLQRADGQVNRLDRLVEDLLDVSRIRTGKLEFHPDHCALVPLVKDLIEEQRQAHPGRTITLRVRSSGDVPLYADCQRIGQVVTNLLTNALKYSPPEKPVEVVVRERGSRVRVLVRDFGQGLPPDEVLRIWEPFHRAQGITVLSGSGVGLGLGLHISKSIVEWHGGAIGVRTAPGKGSTFWFTLPPGAEKPGAGAP